MRKYPALARHSDPHRTATALTIIGVENTEAARAAGLELIESLTVEELQQLAAAFATQAASHCVRSFGGDQHRALGALRKVAAKLAALPGVDQDQP